jgi:hypothetical protein
MIFGLGWGTRKDAFLQFNKRFEMLVMLSPDRA